MATPTNIPTPHGLPPRLYTPRLVVRPVVATDYPWIADGITNPEVHQFFGVRYTDKLSVLDQMTWYATNLHTGTGAPFALVDAQTGACMGVTSIYYIDTTHRTAEIGCWLDKPYWGKGYAQESVRAVTDYAFRQRGLNRVEALVEPDHRGSVRVLEATGYVLEGCKRQVEWKDDRFIDLLLYSKLRSEHQP